MAVPTCEIVFVSSAFTLWLNAACGLLELNSDELQAWWAHSDAKVKPRVFDVHDVGTQIGKQHRRARSGDILAQLDDTNAPQCSAEQAHCSRLSGASHWMADQ